MTTLLTLVGASSAGAQVSDQAFEVTPEVGRATVGDSVSIRFRVRLDERDLLFDTVPQPLSALPPGVRILAIEKMTRTPDRIFHGRVQLAFYRPGRRAVPVFGLPFMRAVKGVQRATLTSDSAFIEIVPLLPPGNPALKDIRELEPSPGPKLWVIAAGALLTLVLLALLVRLRRKRPQPAALHEPVPEIEPIALSPYQVALARLESIARERWPDRRQVARHYESVVDVLRDYLEASEGLPARERTTEELLWALPPHLSEAVPHRPANGRQQTRELLDEADLVKFARLRPDSAQANHFLQRSRMLLDLWHRASRSVDMADALR
jgi:hypothetical protein